MAWVKRRRSLYIPRPTINNELNIEGAEHIQSAPRSNFIRSSNVGNNKTSNRKKKRKNARLQRRNKKRNTVNNLPKNVSHETKKEQKPSTNIVQNEGFNALNDNELTPFDSKYQESVVQEMQEHFNKTQEQREKESDIKRRKTFQKEYGIFGDEYDTLTSTLGNNLFRMLKESMHLDSNQVMDIVHDYNGIADERDIEHALLTLISNINDEYKTNVNMLLDAMQLGFSLSESEYLLSEDLKTNYEMVKGVSALRDIIESEVGLKERQNLLDYIWHEYS